MLLELREAGRKTGGYLYYFVFHTMSTKTNENVTEAKYPVKFVTYLVCQWTPFSVKSIHFLSAFVKLRKATVSFIMFLSICVSVCPSVRPTARNNSAPTGRIFMKFDVCFFEKSIEEIQFSLKSDKNNGYFIWRPMYIYGDILPLSF